MGRNQISFGTLPSMLRQWQDRDRVPSVSSATASTSTLDQQAQASVPETVGSTANFAHHTRPAAGNEPAAVSGQQQSQPGFIAARELVAGEVGPGPSSLSQQASLCRSVLDSQTGTNLSSASRRCLHNSLWSSYRQIDRFVQRPINIAANGNLRRRVAMLLGDDYVSSISMDSFGQLIISGTVSGSLALHHMDDLLRRGSRATAAPGLTGADEASSSPPPRFWMDTERRLDAVRWNCTNENWVGAVSSADRHVHLFDLTRCQNAPTRVLKPVESGPSACMAVGFNDLAFFAQGPFSLAAAGASGQVFVWDTRTGAHPRTVLRSLHTVGAINSLQLTGDGRTLLAGTQSGEVLVWDMRGGCGAPVMFGAQGAQSHSLLGVLSVRRALSKVDQLVAETEIPQSAVHALELDPRDPTLAAFNLACGWSGVLDLGREQVTHVHCPPAMWSESSNESAVILEQLAGRVPGWRVRRRRPTWAMNGSTFCLGSATGDAVLALDFSRGTSSPCAIDSTAPRGMASAVRIPVSQPVVSLTTHPVTDELIAGTQNGYLLLLSPSSRSKASVGSGEEDDEHGGGN